MSIDFSPSAIGFNSARSRFFAISASKPVSTTKVPDGPTIAQTKIVERIVHVVRIAADVVLGRLAVMVAVFDGVDFVDVVGHAFLPRFLSLPEGEGGREASRVGLCIGRPTRSAAPATLPCGEG